MRAVLSGAKVTEEAAVGWLDNAGTRAFSRTTTTPVRNIKADRPRTVRSVS